MKATRRPLVAGNWKMHLDEAEAAALAEATAAIASQAPAVDVAILPSFHLLRRVLDRTSGTSCAVGAQNLHHEDRGAFTGEVSGASLARMGLRFVLTGHSERRTLFGESDRTVRLKVAAARRHGLVPILCVGETESERDGGRTLGVVERQLREAFEGLAAPRGDELVVAYEPVWAIGTGRTPTPPQVEEVHRSIREILRLLAGTSGERIRILYGGSVTADNAGSLLTLPEVDGGLVGGASLDPRKFAAIVAAKAA